MNSSSSSAYASKFSDCNSQDDCTWKLLTQACELLNVQAGTYFELEAEKQTLRVVNTFGVLTWRVSKGHFPSNEGICGWVCQQNQAAMVNDVSKDPRFNGQIDVLTQFKTVSVLCAPISIDGKVLGVLELINRHEQPFTLDDLANLQILTQAAVTRLQTLPQ